MISYQAGELLLVTFPYVGSTRAKIRPSLVLIDTGDDDLVLARVTTQTPSTPLDVPVQDWRGAGLLAPSIVRLHKLVTSEKVQVIRTLGKLLPADHQSVSLALRQVFANW